MKTITDPALMKAFNQAVAAPAESSLSFIDAILAERPDLRGQNVFVPKQGFFAHTVIIGDEVFKGPRLAEGIDYFKTEIDNLREMEGKGLPVPQLTCVGESRVFFGMKRSPGVMMGNKLDGNFTTEEQRQLAADVVDFVIRMAKALPRDKGAFVIHDDLHGENILIDEQTKRFASVIDFGKVKTCTRGEWQPHHIFPPAFAQLLKEEYARHKNELPDKATPPPAPRDRWSRSKYR